MIRRFNLTFLAFDAGIVVFCLLENNTIWLINTQIAFISSMFITIGSYLGYKNNVLKRLDNADKESLNNTPDTIDKLDDPYDLYSEEVIEEKALSDEEVQKIFQEEKAKLKNHKNSAKNLFTSIGAASSFYRIAGYILLVMGFFYLNNHQLLSPIAYLLGFLIVPVATLMTRFTTKVES